MSTTTNSTKSFWERPEGTTGKVIFGGLVLAGLGILYKTLPFLISIAENTIYLGALLAVIAGAWMILTSDRVKSLVFYGFQMLSRSITSLFVDIDPVAILTSFIKVLKNKMEEIDKSMARVKAVYVKLKQTLTTATKEMQEAAQYAEIARSKNDENTELVMLEKVGRREKTIAEYSEQLKVIEDLLGMLERVRGRVKYHIQNSEDEMQELSRRNELSIALQDATDSATSVLGDSDLLEVRNMAADRIREKYATALGELDQLISVSEELGKEVDLNRLALQSSGRAKLEELRARLNTAEVTASQSKQLGTGAAVPIAPENRWADRLRK